MRLIEFYLVNNMLITNYKIALNNFTLILWYILIDALKDSARSSGQDENEEHVTIDTYLDYLEDMKD